MENTHLKLGLVLAIGVLAGAAWLFWSALPVYYLDQVLFANGRSTLDFELMVLLSSLIFGATGALLSAWAGRRLPEAPYLHLLASIVSVLLIAAVFGGPVTLFQEYFKMKLWAFMLGAALILFVAHRRRGFQLAVPVPTKP
jgi:hypothetical protein